MLRSLTLLPMAEIATAFIVASPAAAQTVQLPLFDDILVLHGEFGVLSDERSVDSANVEVWRPITFGTPERPIGGRMDCRLGGVRQLYSDALFDIEQRYKDSRDRREAAGLNDDREREFVEQGPIRRLQVTGIAHQPTRRYVLTYLALQDGSTLYDLRLNCEFKYLQSPPSDTNYAAIMQHYIDIAVPVAMPGAPQNTEQADS